jgi:hypothetical protein
MQIKPRSLYFHKMIVFVTTGRSEYKLLSESQEENLYSLISLSEFDLQSEMLHL